MLWTYSPDWQTPITERLEWKTDVLLAYNGSEQRIALRQSPRRSIEFGFLVIGDRQRRELEVKLWANGAKPWDVPMYMDTTHSTSSINAGSSFIPVDTHHYNFKDDGKVLLQSCTGRYAVINIAAVLQDKLILTQPLQDDWPFETTVIPICTGFLEPSQQVIRFKGDTIYNTIKFNLDEVSSYPIETGISAYRGYPVINIASDWVSDLNTDYQRKMQIIDFGNGGIYRDDETGLPILQQSYYWTLPSRELIYQFKSFLYARRGRLDACWLPSFLPDIALITPVGSNSQQINIEYCGYSDLLNMSKNRRDLRFELTNGTILYRRIIASSVLTSSIEQLTLDSSLGIDLAIDDIERISFMTFSRLDTDAIELSWQWSDLVNVNANWRTINNDL